MSGWFPALVARGLCVPDTFGHGDICCFRARRCGVGLQTWMGLRQVYASPWTRVSLSSRPANWSPLLDPLSGGLAFGLVAVGAAQLIDNDYVAVLVGATALLVRLPVIIWHNKRLETEGVS